MLRILKQARAEDDLVDIWLYSLEKWGGNQADLYLDKLGEGIISIAHNPAIGKDCGHIRQGYRRLHVAHHMIYYRTGPGQIEIIRVLHESMDPDRHL